MKYEIEIDDSLVPEGKVPVSLSRDRTTMLELKFKEAHVPKVPDFVPVGWWFSINEHGSAIMHEDKPCFEDGLWRCRAASWHVTARLTDAEIDAIRGDLPPEQCCFQQKGNG